MKTAAASQANYSKNTSSTAQIIRLPKRSKNFTQILNESLDFVQTNTDPSTVSVFTYMIKQASKTPDHKFTIDDIRKNTMLGRNTVYRCLKILLKHGFVFQEQTRGWHGHYGKSFYKISQTPCYKKQENKGQIIENDTQSVHRRYTVNGYTVTYYNNNISSNYYSNNNQHSSIPVPESDPFEENSADYLRGNNQNPVTISPVQAETPETKSDSSTNPVSPNDVVVENNVKKQKENSELVDYEEQLTALESHKTLQRPVKQDISEISKSNPTTHKNTPKPDNTVNKSPCQAPKSKAKQIFEQVPESYMAELTDDQKHKIWDVIGKNRDRWPDISAAEMAQRLIYSIVWAKQKHGCIKNIAGVFFSCLKNRYCIEKQDTQADLVAQRLKPYVPPKPLTPEEKAEADEYIQARNTAHSLRQKIAAQPIKPNPAYQLRNSYWNRKSRPELSGETS